MCSHEIEAHDSRILVELHRIRINNRNKFTLLQKLSHRYFKRCYFFFFFSSSTVKILASTVYSITCFISLLLLFFYLTHVYKQFLISRSKRPCRLASMHRYLFCSLLFDKIIRLRIFIERRLQRKFLNLRILNRTNVFFVKNSNRKRKIAMLEMLRSRSMRDTLQFDCSRECNSRNSNASSKILLQRRTQVRGFVKIPNGRI